MSGARGMSMLELIIALFVFAVGIIGVLSALPTGVKSADQVIFQDAAIHLAESKFAEFRRDRVDPAVDLVDGSSYLPGSGSFTYGTRMQEPKNGNPGNWRDFACKMGEPYYYFDRIQSYEWNVEVSPMTNSTGGNPAAPANYVQPVKLTGGGGSDIGVYRVDITIRRKGHPEEFAFTQLMTAYGSYP